MPAAGRRSIVGIVAAAAALVGGAVHAAPPAPPARTAPAVAAAEVTGPVTGGLRGKPKTATHEDLAQSGFVEQEFFVSGTARTHAATTLLLPDVVVPPPADGDEARYRTRVLVRRPADPGASRAPSSSSG